VRERTQVQEVLRLSPGSCLRRGRRLIGSRRVSLAVRSRCFRDGADASSSERQPVQPLSTCAHQIRDPHAVA
jgi:hypothetical protein